MALYLSLCVGAALLWPMFAVAVVFSTKPYTSFSKLPAVSCKGAAYLQNITRLSLLSCVYKYKSITDVTYVDYYETSHSCIGCGGTATTVTASTDSLSFTDEPSFTVASAAAEGQGWMRTEKEERIESEKEDPYIADCLDYVTSYNMTDDGIILIKVLLHKYKVYCLNSMHDVGSGWTVFLRHLNGSTSFNRSLKDYVTGFGNELGNHWKGLQFLNGITNENNLDVLVVTGRFEFHEKKVIYEHEVISNFTVGPFPSYRLSVGQIVKASKGVEYMDSCVRESNNSAFSTKDNDFSGASCPSKRGHGGWWWNSECLGNPNGLYFGQELRREDGTYCYLNYGKVQTIKELTMAVRKSWVLKNN